MRKANKKKKPQVFCKRKEKANLKLKEEGFWIPKLRIKNK